MADRCGVLCGRDLRLGVRLLWPERLSGRTAPAARLAGIADFGRDDVLLFVRRVTRRLRRGNAQKIWSAKLPASRHERDGGRGGADGPGQPALAALSSRCRTG